MTPEQRGRYVAWAVLLAVAALIGLFVWQPWKTDPVAQADESWTAAVDQRQGCYDALPATQFPSTAYQVADARCDQAFATALRAIDWPPEFQQDATRVEQDATSQGSIEASGSMPSTAATQQYIADKQQLDDELARARVSSQ